MFQYLKINYLSRILKTKNMPIQNENSEYLFLVPAFSKY